MPHENVRLRGRIHFIGRGGHLGHSWSGLGPASGKRAEIKLVVLRFDPLFQSGRSCRITCRFWRS